LKEENKSGKTTRATNAIARARQALGDSTGGGPGSGGPNSGNPGEDSKSSGGGDVSGQDSGIEVVGGSPTTPIVSGGGSENPVSGTAGGDARSRSNERRASFRNNRHGKTGSGTDRENGTPENGTDQTIGSSETGDAPTDTEEENETLLEFPPEAYFKDGKLKKSWAEKLKPGSTKTPDAKPSALIKKKGISFLGDKELFNQVTEGIQYFFQALDLGAEYGLGVSDVWELDENESAIFARILLKRADKGDKKAIKTIATISENMDYLQAAMIVIPRIGVTIKEVKTNGINPKNPRSRSKQTAPINSPANS